MLILLGVRLLTSISFSSCHEVKRISKFGYIVMSFALTAWCVCDCESLHLVKNAVINSRKVIASNTTSLSSFFEVIATRGSINTAVLSEAQVAISSSQKR